MKNASPTYMFVTLCIIGVLWVAGSAMFILALAAAAKKRPGHAQREAIVLDKAA